MNNLVTVASVAVTMGVALGLLASSTTTNLHASTVVSRPVAVAPVGVFPRQSRVQSAVRAETGLQAATEGQSDVESFQVSQSSGVATWAIAAFLAAGAVVVAAMSAMQRRTYQAIGSDNEAMFRQAGQAMGVAAVSTAIAGSAAAASLTYDEIQSLSYMEVKGSGLANTCPIIADGTASKLNLKAGNYKINNMCLEPSSFQVKVPSPDGKTVTDFEKTKLMTRLTYTLDGIRADLSVGGDGSWTVKEIDGIDYAATTVQLAGGERVPFLFTVKNLQAKGDAGQFIGQFDVASYRGATFLDPKGRGGATGYDTAVALPAAGDSEEYAKENSKSTAAAVGTIAFKVAKVNAQTGEIAGVFESIQPSDTDLGAKVPKDIKASGVWYGQISPA